MVEMIKVQTQGISDDWSTANGDYDTKSRGMLTADQVLSAMLHLAPLDTPTSNDPCPPHVLTQGASGQLSFIGQGGSIYCTEVDQELSPHQAADLALGKASIAPPPPVPSPPQSRARPSATSRQPVDASRMKRKLGWRGVILIFLGLGFLTGGVVSVAGAVSMNSRGITGDDIWAAVTIAGMLGLIGALLVYAAYKRRAYVDETGTVLPYVVMAQMIGGDNFDADGDDFD